MRYPKWIDEWSKASYQLVEGNVIEAFQPLDFYHFFPLWYDLFFEKVGESIDKARAKTASTQELLPYMPVPSSVRAILQRFIAMLRFYEGDPQVAKKIIEFLDEVLNLQCQRDPYGMKENITHTETQLDAILAEKPWQPATLETSREIGRLFAGATSLAHGLYNDVVTDNAIDIYGPYKISDKNGEGIMIIRHFPNLQTEELWPDNRSFPVRELKIYQIYNPEIKIRIPWIGVHIITTGNPVELLRSYAIEVDGKPLNDLGSIQELTATSVSSATAIYQKVKALDFESLKKKVIEQENFQLIKLFSFVEMDWRPSQEMLERVKDKPLLQNLFITGRIMTFEEYEEQFGINKLKQIYSTMKSNG